MGRVMPWRDGADTLRARNRRTAGLLVAWIVFLGLVSLVVIWIRN